MSAARKRICLGAFAGAHGVKGDALVKVFTEAPENIAAYGALETEDGARKFTLAFLRETKPGVVLVRAPEIKSREDAQSLKGERLYVDRAALPETEEDEFYLDDLVGLAAFDETGAPAGRVAAIHNFGAGDLIELSDIPGINGVRMIAFTKNTVPAVDLENRRLTVSHSAVDNMDMPSISDETGEIVSDDIAVDLAAMREEDA